MTWARRKDMTWLRLLEGPGDQVIIPVAPTMKRITYQGEKYYYMQNSQSSWREGEDRGEHSERGGTYLWTGWWASIAARRGAGQPADSAGDHGAGRPAEPGAEGDEAG